MDDRRCSVCGSVVHATKTNYLHEELPYYCSKNCILETLRQYEPSVRGLLPKLPSGAQLVPETIQCPDSAWSKRLHIGFKSDFEVHVAEWFYRESIDFLYEPFSFPISSRSCYIPDFYLTRFGVFVEVKGHWVVRKKAKMSRFLKKYPEVSVILVPWTVKHEFYPN